MLHFTPVPALIGGALIGLAASVLLLANGRVAGISGIVGGLVEGRSSDLGWRFAFLAGMAVAGLVAFAIAPAAFAGQLPRSAAALAASGVLVGFGSRWGLGCTSGHGVCGLSRGSGRSLGATMVFMATAAVTVFIVNHAFGGRL